MTPVTIKAGKALVQEGGVARQFFVIEDGEAEVTRRGRVVAKLGPGDYVGELALLNPAPRNATVTAVTPMAAYALTPTEFETALREAPRMTRNSSPAWPGACRSSTRRSRGARASQGKMNKSLSPRASDSCCR